MFGNAESYEQFMGRWSRLLAPALVDFARIPSAGLVLDVGAGTGSLTFAIAESSPGLSVHGVDPSKEYTGYAASRNRFPDRVTFHTAGAQHLPFEDNSFQATLSLLAFNFIPDAVAALREVCRVTVAHGTIAAAVWDYGDGMQMLRRFWDAAVAIDPAAEEIDEKHMPLCRSGELSSLWTAGGLRDVEERPLEIAMRFSSFDDYWDAFLLGQGPAGTYARNVEPGRRDELCNELRRGLDLDQDDAPFELPARAWAVRGVVPDK